MMQAITTWDAAAPTAVRAAAAPPMNEDEFVSFYARTGPALRAYLTHASRQPALADDLAQEAYVRFLTSVRLIESEAACRRYLFTIATNLLRDHYRRRAAVSLEDAPEPALPAESRLHPEVALAARDTAVRLAPAWRRLKPRQRQLLWLAYVEGYSHREIAAITGLAGAGIRILLFRARRRLAADLELKP